MKSHYNPNSVKFRFLDGVLKLAWRTLSLKNQKWFWMLLANVSEYSYRRGLVQGVLYERRGYPLLPKTEEGLLDWRNKPINISYGFLPDDRRSTLERFDIQIGWKLDDIGITNPFS